MNRNMIKQAQRLNLGEACLACFQRRHHLLKLGHGLGDIRCTDFALLFSPKLTELFPAGSHEIEPDQPRAQHSLIGRNVVEART